MKLMRGEKEAEEFRYRDMGAMATIGRGEAVVGKPKMSGFFAWCAWMFVHLIRLAGAHANFTVAIKWTWNLFSFFPRPPPPARPALSLYLSFRRFLYEQTYSPLRAKRCR